MQELRTMLSNHGLAVDRYTRPTGTVHVQWHTHVHVHIQWDPFKKKDQTTFQRGAINKAPIELTIVFKTSYKPTTSGQRTLLAVQNDAKSPPKADT
jgi:hypothetical protein